MINTLSDMFLLAHASGFPHPHGTSGVPDVLVTAAEWPLAILAVASVIVLLSLTAMLFRKRLGTLH